MATKATGERYGIRWDEEHRWSAVLFGRPGSACPDGREEAQFLTRAEAQAIVDRSRYGGEVVESTRPFGHRDYYWREVKDDLSLLQKMFGMKVGWVLYNQWRGTPLPIEDVQ